MNNYIEYNDTIAFHPGYYVQEIVMENGLDLEDFAKNLNITPQDLRLLMSREQGLSEEVATKLSGILGTSVTYWLNLQNAYDTKIAQFKETE